MSRTKAALIGFSIIPVSFAGMWAVMWFASYVTAIIQYYFPYINGPTIMIMFIMSCLYIWLSSMIYMILRK